MDKKSIYQPGFIHGEISHEMFMHKKLSKNKRDLNGLHKNMVIALAPIFSSNTLKVHLELMIYFLQPIQRYCIGVDILPISSSSVNYYVILVQIQKQLCIYVVM